MILWGFVNLIPAQSRIAVIFAVPDCILRHENDPRSITRHRELRAYGRTPVNQRDISSPPAEIQVFSFPEGIRKFP